MSNFLLMLYCYLDPDIPMFTAEATSPTAIQIRWLPSNGTEWAMPGSTFFVKYSAASRLFHSKAVLLYRYYIIFSDRDVIDKIYF